MVASLEIIFKILFRIIQVELSCYSNAKKLASFIETQPKIMIKSSF